MRCLEAARATPDSRHRSLFVEMAQAWRRLAEQGASAQGGQGDIIRFQNRTEATKEAGITGADRRLNLPPEMKPAAGRQLRQAAGTVAEGVAPAGEEKFTLLPKEQALIDDLFDFAGMRFRTLKEIGIFGTLLMPAGSEFSFEKKRARYGIIRAGPTPAPQPPLCRKWWCRPGRRDRAYAASQQPTRSRQP